MKNYYMCVMLMILFSLSANSQCISPTDCDGDGIANELDLDDDNDGILDRDETNCGTSNSGSFNPLVEAWQNTNLAITQGLTYRIELNTSSIGLLTASGGPNNGKQFYAISYGPSLVSDYDGYIYSYTGGTVATITNRGNTTAPVNISFANLLATDYNPLLIFIGMIDVNGNGQFDRGTDELIPNLFDVVKGPSGGVIFTAPVSGQFYIVYTDNGYTNNSGTLGFTMQTCGVDRDTDNDGVPDRLDNDSDNDGCPDALEGAANFTTANLDANTRLTGGVSSNGVPSIAGAGQAIGTAYDANINTCDPVARPINNAQAGAPKLISLESMPLQGADSTSGTNNQTWQSQPLVITKLPTNGFILKYNGVPVNANQTINNYNPSLLTIEPGTATPDGAKAAAFEYAVIDGDGVQSAPVAYEINFSAGLPVSFGSIEAFINNDILTVNWTSLQEMNNDYFEIQVSNNGKDFATIGTAKTKAPDGNSTSDISYNFSKNITKITLSLSVLMLCFTMFSFNKKNKKIYAAIALIAIMATVAACNKHNKDMLQAGNNTYIRIAQIDVDGSIKYSETVQAIKR